MSRKTVNKSIKGKRICNHEPRVGQDGKKVYNGSGHLREEGFRCLPCDGSEYDDYAFLFSNWRVLSDF